MKQSIAAAILVTLIAGAVATAVVLTRLPAECDWQPFPPDRYESLPQCFQHHCVIEKVTQQAEIFFKKPLDIQTPTHYINNITTATKELS